MKTAHTIFFKDVLLSDLGLVGSKGYNLASLLKKGFPVPNGFVVTSKAYLDFVKETSLHKKILTELAGLDLSDTKKLIEASNNIKTAILSSKLPDMLTKGVISFYHELSGEYDRLVAVRSSGTQEDLNGASFAGQYESFLNISSGEQVVEAVKKCFASLFDSKAIFYRIDKGYNNADAKMAVCVELMVQSEVSGVAFTSDPVGLDSSKICIEAGFGLGAPIVAGELTPDMYKVDKSSLKVVSKDISKQTWQLTLSGKLPVSKAFVHEQKLNDDKIVELSKIALAIEKELEVPCDIEWAYEKKKLYITQVRPITALESSTVSKAGESDDRELQRAILEGVGVCQGFAIGKVRIVKSGKIEAFQKDEIFVAQKIDLEQINSAKGAAAVVLDENNIPSDISINLRSLNIPCVIGTLFATKMLREGEVIRVDGNLGKVYEGLQQQSPVLPSTDGDQKIFKTATKLYVDLSEVEMLKSSGTLSSDGVGILRSEFIISRMGYHPKFYIKEKRQKEFIDNLTDYIHEVAAAFKDFPVNYKISDFLSSDLRNLKAGEQFEPIEANPFIGCRGVSRYIHNIDVFELEMEAVRNVRNKYGCKNLNLLVPYVRTVEELREIKKLISSLGLRRSGAFKLWIMLQVPSNILILEDLLEEGVDGVMVGSKDLSTLTLGADFSNDKVGILCNELDKSLMISYEKIATSCRKYKVASSINDIDFIHH